MMKSHLGRIGNQGEHRFAKKGMAQRHAIKPADQHVGAAWPILPDLDRMGMAVAVLDAVKTARSARAGLKIAVDMADEGIISREEAVLRVQPRALSELPDGADIAGARREVEEAVRQPDLFVGREEAPPPPPKLI